MMDESEGGGDSETSRRRPARSRRPRGDLEGGRATRIHTRRGLSQLVRDVNIRSSARELALGTQYARPRENIAEHERKYEVTEAATTVAPTRAFFAQNIYSQGRVRPLCALALPASSRSAATAIASPAAGFLAVVSDVRGLLLKARRARVRVSRACHFSARSSVALVVGIDAVDEMQVERRQVQRVARLLDDLVRGHAREARELGQPRLGQVGLRVDAALGPLDAVVRDVE